jgi:large subunit ribosomal protein L20
MARVKRGTQHTKRRKSLLEKTKGMMWGRKSKIRLARPAMLKAGVNAYRDRRNKKRSMRRLWQVRLNAAVRPLGLSYSRFMNGLKTAGIALDRKVLSQIAKDHETVFKNIVDKTKGHK